MRPRAFLTGAASSPIPRISAAPSPESARLSGHFLIEQIQGELKPVSCLSTYADSLKICRLNRKLPVNVRNRRSTPRFP